MTSDLPPDSLGTWLRREREKRCWSRTEMARRLIKAAENHGDTTMPGVRERLVNRGLNPAS